jgi:putative Ca2+/H+ antiporter (TMEM165/GDT1 family)
MWELLGSIASAFGLVFLAELGDKTQLLALGFGARYPFRTVLAGLILGFGAAGAVAAIVGGVLGAALPSRPIAIAGGILFIVFALNTLRSGRRLSEPDDDEGDHVVKVHNVVASIALTIAIGELGDKTQLTTATLAAQGSPVAVWIGATAGTVTAASIGAFAGQRLGARLNPNAIRIASAALFALFGVLLLLSA